MRFVFQLIILIGYFYNNMERNRFAYQIEAELNL